MKFFTSMFKKLTQYGVLLLPSVCIADCTHERNSFPKHEENREVPTKEDEKIFKTECVTRDTSNDIQIDIPSEVIARSSSSYPLNINDQDEVLVSGCAIWKRDTPVEFLNIDGRFLANDRTVLGFYDGYSDPFIWTQTLGQQTLNLKQFLPNFSTCHVSSGPMLFEMNDHKTIFGNYTTTTGEHRVFVWKDREAEEFLPKDIAPEGYVPINVGLIAINNVGAVLGRVDYGHKHPLKDAWVIEETKYFLWDKKSYIIDFPPETDPSKNTTWNVYDLNDNNEVLLRKLSGPRSEESSAKYCRDCYIWTPDQKFSLVLEEFDPCKFNNKQQIIGYNYKNINYGADESCVSIFSQGILLNVHDLLKSYDISHLYFPDDINNNGTVLCRGRIWGEDHVFTIHVPTCE